MKSIRKTFSLLAILALLSAGFVTQAEAVPIVSISPAETSVNVGDQFDIDIVVDTDGSAIGGFALLLLFDTSHLEGVSFLTDPGANFDNVLDLSFGFSGGTGSPLDLFFFGDPNPATGVFTLATVRFEALANGVTPLTLRDVVLSDATGQNDIFPETGNGRVCIGQACPSVPEPGLLILLTTGAAVFAVRRRRQRTE